MRFPITINCRETTAEDWNRPHAVAARMIARKTRVANLADLRRIGKPTLTQRLRHWLNQPVFNS